MLFSLKNHFFRKHKCPSFDLPDLFYLIDAKDLNEALQIAGNIPAARVGCVEVRPVRQLNLES